MRKALERLSAFEEATTGRLFTLKGLKVMGGLVVAATILDSVAVQIDRRCHNAMQAEMREAAARKRAQTEELMRQSAETRATEQTSTNELVYQESEIEETEDDR